MQHCHEELGILKNIWFCSTGEVAQHTNIYKPTFLHKYLLSGRHICPHMCLCGLGGRERKRHSRGKKKFMDLLTSMYK